MKPCKWGVAKSAGFTNLEQSNSYGLIKGSTRLNRVLHPHSLVILYSRKSNRAVRIVKSDEYGVYKFAGIPLSERYFIVAFDPKKQKNAVIQDNVVPK